MGHGIRSMYSTNKFGPIQICKWNKQTDWMYNKNAVIFPFILKKTH